MHRGAIPLEGVDAEGKAQADAKDIEVVGSAEALDERLDVWLAGYERVFGVAAVWQVAHPLHH